LPAKPEADSWYLGLRNQPLRNQTFRGYGGLLTSGCKSRYRIGTWIKWGPKKYMDGKEWGFLAHRFIACDAEERQGQDTGLWV